MSYYKKAFEELIKEGVPRWYIRLHALTDLIYCSRIYVYYNPYDLNTQDGWYATSGLALIGATLADRNRKCYGDLRSLGFPTWDEYKMLFDGDEYDSTSQFHNAFVRHQEEWIRERKKGSCVDYAE